MRPLGPLLLAALVLSGCGADRSAPTCDEYAYADPIARKMMVSDELQQHGLDYADVQLQLRVAESVVRHCGPVDPFGRVRKAEKNGGQPFAATVNWAGLQSNPRR